MPLYFDKKVNKDVRICIWEVTESLKEFIKTYNIKGLKLKKKMKDERRLLEYVVSRQMVSKIIMDDISFSMDLFKDKYGKPFIKEMKGHVSISHTKQFVAVMVSKQRIPGIDIEIILPRIEKISERFLNEREKKWITDKNHLEQLYVIWGAKESIYKIYSKGGINFKEMLNVKEFKYAKKGKTTVELRKNKLFYNYPVHWEKSGILMVVYGFSDNSAYINPN